jgi:hypothetical protein
MQHFVWQDASTKLRPRMQSKAVVRRTEDKGFIISQFLSGCAAVCESATTITFCDFPPAKTSRTLLPSFPVAVNPPSSNRIRGGSCALCHPIKAR